MESGTPTSQTSTRLKLALAALGIVFGDIGTSPLYAFRECFSGKHGAPIVAENMMGGALAEIPTWRALVGLYPDHFKAKACALLQSVGLSPEHLQRRAGDLSGGQRQRVGIARALMLDPQIIVADEPVSALDVSVQAQVLNLMQDLSQQYGVTYLLISHDLAVVNHLCDEVVVLYQGRIVERGTPLDLFHHAQHPYTRALLNAVPRIEPGRARARRALLTGGAARTMV